MHTTCSGCHKPVLHASHPCICNLTLCLDCFIKSATARSRGEQRCRLCGRLPSEADALRAAFGRAEDLRGRSADTSSTSESAALLVSPSMNGLGERSRSFSPDGGGEVVAASVSLAPKSSKALARSSMSQLPKAIKCSAGESKMVYSRKFLSLKTLRVQGLPLYALNHVKSFEWLGKYGLIDRVLVIDKSPSVIDVEFATLESAKLCMLDAHGSVIRTGGGENEFRIRVCPCVVHFCPQYLHGIECHNARCFDLHTTEACDWIRALPSTASARQISEIKRDVVRELRAPWKNSKNKPKLLGEAEQATCQKIKTHDHASEILACSAVLAEVYARRENFLQN